MEAEWKTPIVEVSKKGLEINCLLVRKLLQS
jgi:hypothetical protein